MRKNIPPQLPFVAPSIKHDHAAELRAISDEHDHRI